MAHTSKISVAGFARIQLKHARTGRIESDTGWVRNTITEHGYDDYLVGAMGGIAASSQVGAMALGTQTNAVNTTQPLASGEAEAWASRKSVTPTLVGNATLQATASWDTNEANASDPGAVALHALTNETAGSAAAIATFASSAKTTDQTINATYQIIFEQT